MIQTPCHRRRAYLACPPRTIPSYEEVIENCKIFVTNDGRQRFYMWASKVIADAYGNGQTVEIDVAGIVSAEANHVGTLGRETHQ
jgi:hypothetical protein